MNEKIVFFGSGPYVIPILEVLKKNFELDLVFTTENRENQPVPIFCNSNQVRFVSVVTLEDLINHKSLFINHKVAVLASFGVIIPNEILDAFEIGIINVHPSLLPKYRGATPVQAAIINGDEKTGVTIMKLDSELDHGPILSSIEQPIDSNDTGDSLYRTLFQKGAELLSEILPKYIEGKLELKAQDHSKATYTDRLDRNSGFIEINEIPKDKLEIENWILGIARRIRAYYPWPGVWFKAKLNGVEKIIKLFPDQKIQVEGKNVMKLSDFANGYPEGKEILSKLSLS